MWTITSSTTSVRIQPGAVSEAAVFGGGDSGGGGASLDYSDDAGVSQPDAAQTDVTPADFTEADGACLVNSGEAFEDDLSAS